MIRNARTERTDAQVLEALRTIAGDRPSFNASWRQLAPLADVSQAAVGRALARLIESKTIRLVKPGTSGPFGKAAVYSWGDIEKQASTQRVIHECSADTLVELFDGPSCRDCFRPVKIDGARLLCARCDQPLEDCPKCRQCRDTTCWCQCKKGDGP